MQLHWWSTRTVVHQPQPLKLSPFQQKPQQSPQPHRNTQHHNHRPLSYDSKTRQWTQTQQGRREKNDISPPSTEIPLKTAKADSKTTLTENKTAAKPITKANPSKEAENKESTEEENSCGFCWEDFDYVEDAAKHESKEHPKYTKCLHCKKKSI